MPLIILCCVVILISAFDVTLLFLLQRYVTFCKENKYIAYFLQRKGVFPSFPRNIVKKKGK